MLGWLASSLALFAAVPCGCSSSSPAAPAGSDGGAEVGPTGDASELPEGTTVLDKARVGSGNSHGWPYQGTVAADIDFSGGPFANVTLVLDLESDCYPFEKWNTAPPPPGQNWPAGCDAFDRNFSAFIDDRPEVEAGADAGASDPPYEIVHAITPFGGPEHLEVDITDLTNGLGGKHRLRVAIDAWSDAKGIVTGSNSGWIVSAKLRATPGAAPHDVLQIIPLYAGSQGSADAPPVVSFTAPADTKRGRLEYRTSGHGGGDPDVECLGPAEEFCNREHTILVDGAVVKHVQPWRADCATLCTLTEGGPFGQYCLENPCGAPDSVHAPRANWCPGSMTPPFAWEDIAALSAPGPHTWTFHVSTIEPGGSWQVSAIYYAFGP